MAKDLASPPGARPGAYRHLLIPTDGSRLSEEAAQAGVQIARALGARVTMLHVVPEAATSRLDAWMHRDEQFTARLGKVLESHGCQYLEAVRDIARDAGVGCDCALVHGDTPHAKIVAEAHERGCDLIVMASHGRKGSASMLLASETIKVMTLGDIPVLVHHAPRKPAAKVREAAAG